MDTPEVITDESNSVSLEKKDSDSVIQDYNVITTSAAYEQTENILNVPLTASAELENQLIINEEMADQEQSNVQVESVNEAGSENALCNEQELVEEIPIVHENIELGGISIEEGCVEQVIVTTLSEVIACENDSTVTTTCNIQLSSDDIKTENEISESSEVVDKGEAESDNQVKSEENISDCSNTGLNQSLPSFMSEVDESVSLPPAEPLILEQENIPEHSSTEEVPKNVEEQVILSEDVESSIETEIVTESSVVSEIVTDNSIESETVHENISEKENSIQDETSIEGETSSQDITLNEIVAEDVTMNEIELAGPPQTEIITSGESNIQYTVLPPGENSVYQEDGTLVVEYPLESTEISQKGTLVVNDLIESSEIETVVEGGEIIPKAERNVVESEGAPIEEEETISNEAGTSSEVVTDDGNREQTVEKRAPKPKGRKSTGCIPPHIIGHTMDKPVQDVPNGKGLKPRLGVRIPYRKLASQIVSSSELENHIAERAKAKEEARCESEKTTSFTKKLTHRLAQSLSGISKKDPIEKINVETISTNDGEGEIQMIENMLSVAPNNESSTELQPTNPIEFVEQIVNEETVVSEISLEKATGTEINESSSECIENAEIIFADNASSSTNIENNSDLIAILEGDGEETSSLVNVPNVVEIVDTSENASEIKAIEKEISLTEQKISKPATPQVKEKKFFKSRESRVSDATKEKPKETQKTKPSVINITANTKIVPVKKDETAKSNIFDSESTTINKGTVKSSDSKNPPLNAQEKSSEVKGKSKVVEVEPQLKPAMALKTYTRKRKSNDVSTPEPAKKPLIMPPPPTLPDPKIDCVTPVPPNVYITKSSRVIKKKVIWDPDEAMPSVRNQSKILSKIEATGKLTPPTKVPATQKQVAAKAPEKKVNESKQTEPPKITRSVEKKVTKPIQDEKEKKNVIEKTPVKKFEKIEVTKRFTPRNLVAEKNTPQTKVIITSSLKISAGKSPKKTPKRLTEIDRLLMDEGAVNMLYEINNSDDQKRRASGRLGTTPTEKAQNQQELLNRTQEIKNELTKEGTNVEASTIKTLRKKEGPPPLKKEVVLPSPSVSRKMSKDSTKSSVHSPPPSPAAFTPAEASRIIRRHSSSSFSSTDGIAQNESVVVDQKVRNEKEKEKQNKKKEAPAEKTKEPASMDVDPVPEQNRGKAIKKKASITPEVTPKKKPKLRQEEPVMANGDRSNPTTIVIKSEPGIVTGALKTDPTKAFTVIKMNKHYMINLTYCGGENYLTVQLLKDLIVTLKELERTRNCSVVSINSQGPAFCLGIDYKGLVEPNEMLRNKKLTEMSNWIREFLKCLLNFSKIIVAGIKGDCIGFGVTMLPLFDMVVATDTASFCTPYAKIGCPPEAGFLLSVPYQSNHGLASELLYTAQRMNADEAQRRGLVTKLFWPEKFDSEFRGLLAHISNLSKPALMMTKKQLRRVRCQNTETEISANSKLLVRFWGSEECQNDFVNYNALTFDLDN